MVVVVQDLDERLHLPMNNPHAAVEKHSTARNIFLACQVPQINIYCFFLCEAWVRVDGKEVCKLRVLVLNGTKWREQLLVACDMSSVRDSNIQLIGRSNRVVFI